MSAIGNLLWIIFGGFFIFLEYIFAGLVLCLTIIGIPFGLQCFKMGIASLVPFGKKVVDLEGTSSTMSLLLNVVWILIGGLWIALSHLALGLLLCVTVIGIPFGIQHFKLMQLGFMPFGKDLR
jgi:uncharacterized membrane protein YccF (DUF307 family)